MAAEVIDLHPVKQKAKCSFCGEMSEKFVQNKENKKVICGKCIALAAKKIDPVHA